MLTDSFYKSGIALEEERNERGGFIALLALRKSQLVYYPIGKLK